MRSDADRLSDILDAVAKIGERITESIDAFQVDEMLQVWVVHHLQVIGEAARGVSQSLKDLHPEVPWSEIVALRNPDGSRWHPGGASQLASHRLSIGCRI
jgi:uncharacterized protein with HEPN domain